MLKKQPPRDLLKEQALIHQKPLTGLDYITKSVSDLIQHKDYSAHAMRVLGAILEMSTEQLERIPIARGPH